MGLISDILEDTREREFAFAYGPIISIGDAGLRRGEPGTSTVLIECPACPERFVTTQLLTSHLRARHEGNSCYVRVNGVVAPDHVVIDEDLTELVIVPLGSAPITVVIRTDDDREVRTEVQPGIARDLRTVVRAESSGTIRIRAKVGAYERDVVVYWRTRPELQSEELDDLVTYAQMPLLTGEGPRWQWLAESAAMPARSDVESRYLRGFAEYLLSVDLEAQGRFHDGARALERAWAFLRVFTSARAETALQILEYRIGAFEAAVKRRNPGPIRIASGYLQSPPLAIAQAGPSASGEDGIWIDDAQERFVAAACAMGDGNASHAIAELDRLPASLIGASGNRRKELILRARAAESVGDHAAAMACWQELAADPRYGAESRRATD